MSRQIKTEELLHRVFECLDQGWALKDSISDAVKKYGNGELIPLSYQLHGGKGLGEQVNIKFYTGEGYRTIAMSREAHNRYMKEINLCK